MAIDDDQPLAILVQISVGYRRGDGHGAPGSYLAADEAGIKPGERCAHAFDIGVRGTPSTGVEPSAKTAHTRISAGGGWLKKAVGLAVRPYAPDWNTTMRS